jgi:hypothetical protein
MVVILLLVYDNNSIYSVFTKTGIHIPDLLGKKDEEMLKKAYHYFLWLSPKK